MKKIILLGAVCVLVLIAGSMWMKNRIFMQKPVACIIEEKLCPDGTTVGRYGPNCEFIPCPSISKSYTSSVVSFQYPSNLTLEERQKNYLVLLADSNNPSSVVFSVDARVQNDHASFDRAVETTKENLTDLNTQEISDGILISGTIGPGYGQGTAVAVALFRYGQGAISMETTGTDSTRLAVFQEILSTVTVYQ